MTISLAPLHGLTNRVFRQVYFHHFSGMDAALAPFILAVPGDRLKSNHFKDLIPDGESKIPLVPQILGNDAPSFVASAKIIADLGFKEVNWNLGCPFPMVARKGRGSGLLPYPERIAHILDELCPQLKIPLSLKIRLGRNDPTELLRLMPTLNNYPIKKIIIHPRIGIQMYKGEVDLDGFERAANLCQHEIVYNGDIKDVAAFECFRRRFPFVKEWMIGRWAIADPFLAGNIRGLDPVAAPLTLVHEFHDELYAAYRSVLYGPAHLLDKMKELWTYLGRSISGVDGARAAVARAKTPMAYECAVGIIFTNGNWKK